VLRSLLADFARALEAAGKEAIEWLSIEQVRVLKQRYLAVLAQAQHGQTCSGDGQGS
jgi:hypothetical protein